MLSKSLIKAFTPTLKKADVIWKKYHADIKFFGGLGCIVASEISACRATLKISDVLDETKENVTEIKHMRENKEEFDYDDTQYKKDLFSAYKECIWNTTKLYGRAAVLLGLGLYGTTSGYNDQKEDKLFLATELASVRSLFDAYRGRVVEDQGANKDAEYYYGFHEDEVEKEVENAKGKKKKIKEKVMYLDGHELSPYSRFFGPDEAEEVLPKYYPSLKGYQFEKSKEWEPNWNEYNAKVLTLIEDELNYVCRMDNYMSMADALMKAGYKPTQESFKKFKVWDNSPDAPVRQISLHIVDICNIRAVNGYEPVFIIDFRDFKDTADDLPINRI